MNIIAVDDNRSDLLELKSAIKEAAPNCKLSCFTKTEDALKFAAISEINAAFIEPDIDDGKGVPFAYKLSNRKIKVVFAAKGDRHAMHAFYVGFDSFRLKPISAKTVSYELSRMPHPIRGDRVDENEPSFTIKTKDGGMTVPFSSILCVKYCKRMVTFEVESFEPLYCKALPWRFGKIIAPLLEDGRFSRVDKHCVINMGTTIEDID